MSYNPKCSDQFITATSRSIIQDVNSPNKVIRVSEDLLHLSESHAHTVRSPCRSHFDIRLISEQPFVILLSLIDLTHEPSQETYMYMYDDR